MALVAAVLVGIHLCIAGVLAANFVYLRRHRPSQSEQSDANPAADRSIAVLIPARNEADNLQRLLPSLLEQTHRALQIWIYDDRSTDATADVVDSFEDDRLHLVRGTPLPGGWLGKPHALYQLAQRATADWYVFLDADTELHHPNAVAQWARQFATRPTPSVATGLPRLRGGAAWLVSLVPNAMLTGLPWPLVERVGTSSLGALNGQFWMLDSATYHAYEPHRHVRDKVLEDVEIGRYLKSNGIVPYLWDVRDELTVYMYPDTASAWRGFRKNAYLLMGGHPAAFVPLCAFYTSTFVLAPWVVPWLWGSVFGFKLATDRWNGIPWHISLLAPLSYAAGAVLQVDSAWHHWTRNVSWKGRSVAAHTASNGTTGDASANESADAANAAPAPESSDAAK